MKTCSLEFSCSWEDTHDDCKQSEIKSIVYGVHYGEEENNVFRRD